jgi:NAD(P)H dehydrogenase (quinone)
MIQITGATGQLGNAVVDFLLKKGIPAREISALVRDKAKASALGNKGITLKVADYRNFDSLVEAFKGVEKLLLISSSDLEDRTSQHINAIRAAKQAGVKHILYTSFQRKNEINSPIQMISDSHLQAEREIKATGMTYTILQNGLYAENLPWFFGAKVLETGIYFPAGDTKASYATRADMAEAIANVISETGHEKKTYLLTSPENHSVREIAKMLSELTGKDVPYIEPSKEEYVETLTRAGVPGVFIGMLSGFAQAIKEGEFVSENNELEKLLHHKPVELRAFLRSAYVDSK